MPGGTCTGDGAFFLPGWLCLTSVPIRKCLFTCSPSFRPSMHVLHAQCHSAISQQLQRGSAHSSAVQMKYFTEVDFLER